MMKNKKTFFSLINSLKKSKFKLTWIVLSFLIGFYFGYQYQGEDLSSLLNQLTNTKVEHYNRNDWNYGIIQKDHLYTRHSVLKRDSLIKAEIVDHKVVKGYWKDPYTGRYFTDPNLLEIDHLVPLAEAYYSGGMLWPKEKKEAYANDITHPYHLIAVYHSANQDKGSKDPTKWLPSNKEFQCPYIKSWIEIKKRWNLDIKPEVENLYRKKCLSK